MMRTTLSVLAALMLGGASVALAGGAGKSTSDQSQSPARSEASGATSGSSGMSAGESSKSGSTTAPSGATGSSGAAAGSASQMSATDIEAKLEKQGYTQVTGVKKVGDKFEAKAMKNGKAVNVEVDAATGMVKDKS